MTRKLRALVGAPRSSRSRQGGSWCAPSADNDERKNGRTEDANQVVITTRRKKKVSSPSVTETRARQTSRLARTRFSWTRGCSQRKNPSVAQTRALLRCPQKRASPRGFPLGSYRVADRAPPLHSGTTTNSTRLLLARPSVVVLGATGLASPMPLAEIFAVSMPWLTRCVRTDCARLRLSS